MEASLVSIIMPVHNCSKFISSAIGSVISQTYQNWELIIIDDASTDNSVSKIKYFVSRDNRIKFFRVNKNIGPARARNLAIEYSRGEFIAFLDSDDIWYSQKLEKQVSFMLKTNHPFTFTAYDKIDEKGNLIGSVNVPAFVSYDELLKTCVIGCLTAMYHIDYFGKTHMPINTLREDFGLWLQLLKKIEKAYGLNESLAQYRVYNSQSSAKKFRMAIENWRLYRKVEKLSLLLSIYYFSHYAVRGILRTKMPSLARKLGLV